MASGLLSRTWAAALRDCNGLRHRAAALCCPRAVHQPSAPQPLETPPDKRATNSSTAANRGNDSKSLLWSRYNTMKRLVQGKQEGEGGFKQRADLYVYQIPSVFPMFHCVDHVCVCVLCVCSVFVCLLRLLVFCVCVPSVFVCLLHVRVCSERVCSACVLCVCMCCVCVHL